MNDGKLQYPAFDEKTNKVVCQICGKGFLVISPRHLGKHNISYTDYTKRYPTAPLSSKEFSAKTKYGKVKDLFTPTEIKPDDDLGEVIVHEQPTIEEDIAIDQMLKEKAHKDPIRQLKAQVLDTLRMYLTNIRQDFLITEYGSRSGNLKYQFITDFADPILRVVVQFPNTFWHNKEVNVDPMKNDKLESDGWRVLIVKSKNPSRKNIHEVVDQI